MEASRGWPHKMIYPSLRQSDNWFEYMKFLGWSCKETSSGIKIALLKTPLGTVTKIQRPPSFSATDLGEIEEICKKAKALFIKIEPADDKSEVLLKENGYVMSGHPLCPPSTLIIDLTKSEEDLWNDLSRSGKYSVKRAKREGSVVEFYQKPSKKTSTEFFKTIKETSDLRKFYIQPFKDLHKKVKLFKEHAHFAVVRNSSGDLMGVKFFVSDEEQATFLHGGTTKVGRKGKWGYGLLWESILYLKKQGYKYLDLEGIDDDRFVQFTREWGGFSHFKEKFGGTVVRFPPPYIKYLNPMLKTMSKILPLPL